MPLEVKTPPDWVNDPDMKEINFAVESEKDFNKALNRCNAVLAKPLESKKKAHVYVHLGVIHYRKGELDKADKMWTKALEINPNDDDAAYNSNKIKTIRK